jgi:hypothetical protein
MRQQAAEALFAPHFAPLVPLSSYCFQRQYQGFTRAIIGTFLASLGIYSMMSPSTAERPGTKQDLNGKPKPNRPDPQPLQGFVYCCE